MAANPWQFFTAAQIATITRAPQPNIETNWPKLVEQLEHCGINNRPTQIAMIGTVAIESARTFRPVGEAFYLEDPETYRRSLRYYPYYGRGYIQLTWETNYAKYGPKIAALWNTDPNQPDFNLVGDPERAMDPDISAAVSALYFRDHGGDGACLIPKAAAGRNWTEVRRLVQGGASGLSDLTVMCEALWALPMPGAPPEFDKAAVRARLNALLTLHEQYDAAIRAEFDKLLKMVD